MYKEVTIYPYSVAVIARLISYCNANLKSRLIAKRTFKMQVTCLHRFHAPEKIRFISSKLLHRSECVSRKRRDIINGGDLLQCSVA